MAEQRAVCMFLWIYCMSVANARSYHQSIAPCTVCCYLHPMKDIVLTDIGAYKLRLPAPFANSLWWRCDTQLWSIMCIFDYALNPCVLLGNKYFFIVIVIVNNSLATDFCGAVKPSVRSTFVQLRYIHPKIFIDVCYVEIKYITPTTVLNWKTSHKDFDMCKGVWTDVLLDHTSSSVRWNYNHSEKNIHRFINWNKTFSDRKIKNSNMFILRSNRWYKSYFLCKDVYEFWKNVCTWWNALGYDKVDFPAYEIVKIVNNL